MDEFISSGEQKWGQRSGVVLLLPHGYEGQGPDHSSARLERFLSLCAQDNMTVAVPSTPASYFHLLRWQALSARVKPLIVFTPEVDAAAEDGDLGGRRLHQRLVPAGARRAGADSTTRPCAGCCSCSGKVYYDLADRRRAEGRSDVAILRVERLYPLPADEIKAELARYPAATEVMWVQEEPGQHGRVAVHGPQAARDPRPAGRPGVAARVLGAGRRLGQRPRRGPRPPGRDGTGPEGLAFMYFTDRGIEELAERRGEDQVTLGWLAERLTEFVDLHPEAEASVDRLASWLARLDDDEE